MSEILKQQIAEARELIEKQDGLCFTVRDYGRILTQLEIAVSALHEIANRISVSGTDIDGGPCRVELSNDRNARILQARQALKEMEKA